MQTWLAGPFRMKLLTSHQAAASTCELVLGHLKNTSFQTVINTTVPKLLTVQSIKTAQVKNKKRKT